MRTENLFGARQNHLPSERDDRPDVLLPSAIHLTRKSKNRFDAENAILRHQLIVLERKIQGRVRLTNSDRLFFIWLYRWFPPTWMPFGSSDPIPWCGGTVTVFDIAGIGSPHRQVIGHESMRICIP